MSYESPGAAASVASSCHYGRSKLPVRGPLRQLDRPYVALLGGSETFGRFVARPFADLLESRIGQTCVNLGSVNAGLDAYCDDPDLMCIARGAHRVVIQLPDAQNLSNRFYRVHPRRNDRFLAASARLAGLYREVDFTEFAFNRHMLGALLSVSRDRFSIVRSELQDAWMARMRSLLRHAQQPALLLWLRRTAQVGALGPEPLFVGRDMVRALAAEAAGVVEVDVRPAAMTGELPQMEFAALQAPAAAQTIGPATHREIAMRLVEALRRI